MEANAIKKYRKLVFFVMFCAFFISAYAENCCLNPNYVDKCLPLTGTPEFDEVLCCGPLSGLPAEQYDECADNWFVAAPCSSVIPECNDVCCVGQTKTCDMTSQIYCETVAGDNTNLKDVYGYYQRIFDKDCSYVDFCKEGCCCDDEHPSGAVIKLYECKEPKDNFYAEITNVGDCSDTCGAAAGPCLWTSCNGINSEGCVCGAATTDADNRYCCAADGKVYGSDEDCKESALCKEDTYSVSGYVRDNFGAVKGAKVTIGTKEAFTANDGSYIVDGLTKGWYTVIVIADCCRQGKRSEEIIDSDLLNINFKLDYTGICGDGIVDGEENCDDGKQCDDGTTCEEDSECSEIGDKACKPRSEDGCSNICQIEGVCGDGNVDYDLGEECDEGKNRNGQPSVPCTKDCKAVGICGNGITDGEETCDKGKRCESSPTTDCTKDPNLCLLKGPTDCKVIAIEGCSATCHLDTETCTSGDTMIGFCSFEPKREPVTSPLDDKEYVYDCPTWEVCHDPDGDGVGNWKGYCEKQNPNCPTYCWGEETDTRALGGTYCPSHISICKNEILSPDIVEGDYENLVCCEGLTQATLANPVDLCKAKPVRCEFSRCEGKNTELPCPCGDADATALNPFCCARSNAVFGVDKQDDCYQLSECSVGCLDKNPEDPVNIVSDYPDGCFCYGETRTSGYCCLDNFWVTDQADCATERRFVNLEGFVTDTKTNDPIEGAVVSVRAEIFEKKGTDLFIKGAVTNAKGYYRLERIPQAIKKEDNGEITYKAEYDYVMADKRHHYFPVVERPPEKLFAVEFKNIKDFVLEPLPKWEIGGKVNDTESGALLAGAQVTVSDIEIGTTTDDDGIYLFDEEVVHGLHPYTAWANQYSRKTIMHNTLADFYDLDFSLRKIECTFGKYLGAPEFEGLDLPFMKGVGNQLDRVISLKDVLRLEGALGFNIKWESGCVTDSFNIYRCEAEGGSCEPDQLMGSVTGAADSFVDKFIEPGKRYCYKVGAEHVEPFFAEVLTQETVCEFSAHEKCFFSTGAFCEGDNVMICDEGLQKSPLDNCADVFEGTGYEGTCGYPLGSAACLTKDDCEECNKPLGLFGKIGKIIYGLMADKKSCEDIAVCYEDYTNTSVDKYYSCNDVTTCYDYRSKKACEQNKCLPRDCVWTFDDRYGELGFGVCREQSLEEKCPGDRDCDGALDGSSIEAVYEFKVGIEDELRKHSGTDSYNIKIEPELGGAVNFSENGYIKAEGDFGLTDSFTVTALVNLQKEDLNYVFDNQDNSIFMKISDNSRKVECGVNGKSVTSDKEVEFNDWSHVACVYDGEKLKVYVGGVKSEKSVSATPSLTTLYIGNYQGRITGGGSNDYSFTGLIGRLIVYSRALGDNELEYAAENFEGEFDLDSDNDGTPDIYDPDDRTGIDILQNCSVCNDDAYVYDEVFQTCDKHRCGLHGICLFDESSDKCHNRKDISCYHYKNADDCIGNTGDFEVDISNNKITQLSDDYFGFGVCSWKEVQDGADYCAKDYDNDGVDDCSRGLFITPEDLKCSFDINPPLTVFPPRKAYSNGISVLPTIIDRYTNSYAKTNTFIKLLQKGDTETTTAPPYTVSLEHDDKKGSEDLLISHLENFDVFDANGQGDYDIYYYSQNALPFNRVHDGYSSDNIEPVNKLSFYYDNVPPLYMVEPLHDVDEFSKMFTGEETENKLSYVVTAYMTGEDSFATDLFINFTLDEVATCFLALRENFPYPKGKKCDKSETECWDYNDVIWEYGNYSDEYSLLFKGLDDGYYHFTYYCYDRLLNWVKEDVEIHIDADPSIKIEGPTGTIRSRAKEINLELITGADIECRYTTDLDSDNDAAWAAAVDNKFTGKSGEPGKHIHTEPYFLGDVVAQGYRIRALCKTKYFGIRDDLFKFTIDNQGPRTIVQKIGPPEYSITSWYDRLKFNLKCDDPKIEGGKEFGCGTVYRCVGTKCEPLDSGSHETQVNIGGKIAKEFCYFSEDTEGNRGAKRCDLGRIDNIAPILDGVRFEPQVTNKEQTQVVIVPDSFNYISDETMYGLDFTSDSEHTFNEFKDEIVELEDVVFKAKVGYEELVSGDLNTFEVVRLRSSDKGHYSVKVDANYKRVELWRSDLGKLRDVALPPGNSFDFEIKASGETLNVKINGDLKISRRDSAFSKGLLIIPKVDRPDPKIQRSIKEVRIGALGRTSPIWSSYMIVNEDEEQRYDFKIPSSFPITNLVEGENTIDVYVQDSREPRSDPGEKRFIVYRDLIGPETEMNVTNYEGDLINDLAGFSQFGTEINFSVSVEDREYTNTVAKFNVSLFDEDGNMVYLFENENPAIKSHKFSLDNLDVGTYELVVGAVDPFANTGFPSTFFAVRDTEEPEFNFSLQSATPGVVLFGPVYTVNVTASEPIKEDSIELKICIQGEGCNPGSAFSLEIADVSDDKTRFNFTFRLPYAPYTKDKETEAWFWINAKDANNIECSSTVGCDVRDEVFSIDTKGGPKPIIIYPLIRPFYVNKDSVLVTGYDGKSAAGRDIGVFVANESVDAVQYADWLWSDNTKSLEGGQRFGSGIVYQTASAGLKEFIIERNDPLSTNMYIDFFHATKTGLFYGIESKTVLPNPIYETLVLDRALEQDVERAGDTDFDFYDKPYPDGFFELDVSLGIGDNYLYAFSYDEHNVRSEPSDTFMYVISDPFKPEIEVKFPYEENPYDGHLILSEAGSIIANITENITEIDEDSINLTIKYYQPGTPWDSRQINCSCGICEPEGTMRCLTLDNKLVDIEFIPAGRRFEANIYDAKIGAKDLAGNSEIFEWRFEIDPGVPHDPVVKSPDGIDYKLVMYTKEASPDLFIEFLRDQGKFVDVSEVWVEDESGHNARPRTRMFDATSSLVNAVDLYGVIPEEYITNYSLGIGENTFTNDGTYYIGAKAKKLLGLTADGNLNWSDKEVIVYGSFVVDTTPPTITIEMETPTMIKNPIFNVRTDDPSNCSYYTEQYTGKKYFDSLGFDFEDRLEKHELEMKTLSNVRYSKTQHMDHVLGGYDLTVSCTNILGLNDYKTYPFKLVFPKRDKIFYKQEDTINIVLKLDEPGLRVEGDFSSVGGTDIVTTSSGNEYTLSYDLGDPEISNDQYEILIDIWKGANPVDQTSALIYYHNADTWDYENDVQAAVSCYNSDNPGVYFGETWCDLSSDLTFSLFKYRDLSVEEECDDGRDNDGDGMTDCQDSDCGGVLYGCRNTMQIKSAVNVLDPRNIIKLDLKGGTKLFHLANVRPGGNLKARFVMENIPGLSSQFSIKGIPLEWGVTEDNANVVDDNNILTKFVPGSGDQLQAGPAVYTGALKLLMDVPVGQATAEYTLEFLRSVNDATRVFSDMSKVSVDTEAIVDESDYVDDSYYGCYDFIDNDLDSDGWAFKNKDRNINSNPVGDNGVDCWDTDCDGKPARRTDGAVCEYQNERTCYDLFDNDLDDDNGNPDYAASGGVDCRDIDCDGDQGDADNANLKCEHRRELTCDDGFDNDNYQQKDCDLAETSDNPTNQEVYGKAEYDCRDICRAQEVDEEKGQDCNDNKDNDYDYFLLTNLGKSEYLMGTKNANGGIDCRFNSPDPDCGGETFTDDSGRTGVCELNNEVTCDDGFDNDQDSAYQPSTGWDETAYNDYFWGGEDKYFKGADCDDYSCAGSDACPQNENAAAEWCFDGADNDLDNNLRTNDPATFIYGIDCKDKDCDGVEHEGKLCQHNIEESCTDGFDNDGDGDIDQDDSDCRIGSCYPFPEFENITYDSCSDNINQNFNRDANNNELTDCLDTNCDGLPCGPASTCQLGECVSLINEVCGNNKDDDFDGLYDCYDTNCYGEDPCTDEFRAGMCYDSKNNDAAGGQDQNDAGCAKSRRHKTTSDTVSLPNSGVSVSYNKYVRIGEKLRVEFSKTGQLSNTAVALAVGDGTNKISQITNPTLANTFVGTGFSKTVDTEEGNGISAQNTDFSGSLNTYIEVTVTKALFETKTLGLTVQVGDKIDLSTINVFVSESTDPILPNIYHIDYVAGGYRFWVEPTDAQTGIDRCEFKRNTGQTITANECWHIFPTLEQRDRINVKAFDGAGNTKERDYTISLPSITVSPLTLTTYVDPEESLEFSTRFTGATRGTCTAKVYDQELDLRSSDEFVLSDGTCEGSIDITDLDNGTYSLVVESTITRNDYATDYEQFFKCRYTEFGPESEYEGKIHCMDSCQISRESGDYHTCDQGEDGFCVVGCIPIDPDCGEGETCEPGDGCKSDCVPVDEDCGGASCEQGDGCLANCDTPDPDCEDNICEEDGFCVVGCDPIDPDCGGPSCEDGDGCIGGCDTPDPDCDNFTCEQGDGCLANCDILDIDCEEHTCDDGEDGFCVVGCIPIDPDCGEGETCEPGDGCKSDCVPVDEDCGGASCEQGDGCLANCDTPDPDCEDNICEEDGFCVVGCDPIDPDCGGPSCEDGDGCIGGCDTPDPDCDGATCEEDDACLADCNPPDLDCGTGDLFIGIVEPRDGSVVYNPVVDLVGVTIDKPNLLVNVFVNTLTESQYQAQVQAEGIFRADAILLSQEENTITVKVADEGIVATDSIDLIFRGVDVETEIRVNGLPDKIDSIDALFKVKEGDERIDLTATTVNLSRESKTGDIPIDVLYKYPGENRITVEPVSEITEAGTYKVEAIPMMESGKYGVGEVYRFSYCPDGSHIFYTKEPESRTKEKKFEAEGHIEPVPDSAKLVFIQSDGTRKIKDIVFDNQTGEFNLYYEDLIERKTTRLEEINSYYVATILKTEEGGEVECPDISRSIRYDVVFAGIKDPFILGEEEEITTEDKYPSLDLSEPIIGGKTIEQNGVALPVCGEINEEWCKEENPNAGGEGPFEFKWEDGSVTCSWFPASHTYTEDRLYKIKVRVRNTCGFISERESEVIIA